MSTDGTVLCGVPVDLNEAIGMCTSVACAQLWHPTRRFGGSIVIMTLYDGDGHSFVGLLRAAVDVARAWGVGQRYLSMIRSQTGARDESS